MKKKEILSSDYIRENFNTILKFIDLITVGIFITDGNGDVIMLNKESLKTSYFDFDHVINRNMRELESIGYVDESSVLKAIELKDEFTMVQNCKGDVRIFITATPYFDRYGNVDLVICTERDITETLNLEELLKEHKKLSAQLKREIKHLKNEQRGRAGDIIAESPQMKQLLQTAKRISSVDTTVMILGESGVGKEVLADYLVNTSKRAEKPFVKINCASIPENLLESELFGYEPGAFTGADAHGKKGIFEMANHGTLFLDEISEIPIHIQAKLLRVLQEHEIRHVGGQKDIKVDVRVIVASNKDLFTAVSKGEFREDLYYRLNVLPLTIPPLRERREDIPYLVRHFINLFNIQHKTMKEITDDAMHELEQASWPGNVRELQNVIERMMVSYDGMKITVNQVRSMIDPQNATKDRFEASPGKSLKEQVDDFEKNLIQHYLDNCDSAAEAARSLGIDKSTMSRKMKKYNL